MSIQDASEKVKSLVTAIDNTYRSYSAAKHALDELESGDLNLSGIGMSLTIGDITVPIPLSNDLPPNDTLNSQLVMALNTLGAELTRLWQEMAVLSSQTYRHCADAVDAANVVVPPAQQMPPAQPLPQAQPLPPGYLPAQPASTPNQPGIQAGSLPNTRVTRTHSV